MTRTPLERLRDARHFASSVEQIALVMDPDIFDEVEYYRYAVSYCLLAIGEALRHVPAELRSAAPGIPWRSIVAMRHRLARDYWLINSRLVLETANKHVLPLIQELDGMIARLTDEAE